MQDNLVAGQGQDFAIVRYKTHEVTGMVDCSVYQDCDSFFNISLTINSASGSGSIFSRTGSHGGLTAVGNCVDTEIAPDMFQKDCTVVELIKISGQTIAGPASLTFLAQQRTGNFFNPIGYSFDLDLTFSFTLTNTKKSFLPRDSSDPASNCSANPDELGCVSTYQASLGTLFMAQDGFAAPITPTTSSGLPSITTSNPVSSATVAVTSLDYGGIGILRAKAVIDGTTYFARVMQFDMDGDFSPHALTCAADFQTKQYAQLPIDVDCNWIADAWEFTRANQAVAKNHFQDKYWDEEIGDPLKRSNVYATARGDGFGRMTNIVDFIF